MLHCMCTTVLMPLPLCKLAIYFTFFNAVNKLRLKWCVTQRCKLWVQVHNTITAADLAHVETLRTVMCCMAV